jgi:hypothetical protein
MCFICSSPILKTLGSFPVIGTTMFMLFVFKDNKIFEKKSCMSFLKRTVIGTVTSACTCVVTELLFRKHVRFMIPITFITGYTFYKMTSSRGKSQISDNMNNLNLNNLSNLNVSNNIGGQFQ